MNLVLWGIGGLAVIIVGWVLYSAGRGLVRLRPQIAIASRKARQQNQSLRVERLKAEELLFEAQRGDLAAQTRVGVMFATGDGLPHDDHKAFGWYERAAVGGFAEAQYYAGLSFEHGRGVEKDYAKAHHWYEKAASNGHTAAQCNLGMLYFRGLAGEEAWITAVYWVLKAAAQKNAIAISNLEWFRRHKDEAPRNSATILQRYRESAARGDADAAFLLGWCCEHGLAAAESFDDAVRWYQRAETLGHLHAREALNDMQKQRKPSPVPSKSSTVE